MGEPRCFHVVSACRRVRTCAIALALVGTVSLVVACSGDTTEGTGIAPTMSVPMTPATPGSETSLTEMRALGLTFLRSKISCARSSME